MKFILNDESGFTLLEALISLGITAVILLTFTAALNQIKSLNATMSSSAQSLAYDTDDIKGDRQIEWHIFLAQLETYLTDTKLLSFTSKEIVVNELNENGTAYERVRYHRTDTGARNFRRSKNNGHNALLTDIDTYRLDVNGGWLFLNFTFRNGESYTGRIWIETWQNDDKG